MVENTVFIIEAHKGTLKHTAFFMFFAILRIVAFLWNDLGDARSFIEKLTVCVRFLFYQIVLNHDTEVFLRLRSLSDIEFVGR